MTDLERIVFRLSQIEKQLQETHKSNRYITLREAVEYTGLSDSTLRRLVYDGKLTCSRKSGKLLFKTDWIDKWLIYGKKKLTQRERKKLLDI